MEVIPTGFKGLVEIRPRVFGDDRGWFMESFNEERYVKELGLTERFVQDNISSSEKHSLRGLHFQSPPYAQSKLVMVTQGSALDIVVDIRKGSTTYGEYFKIVLDSETKNQLFVPRGFAHGFLSLEEGTIFQYKCDNLYNRASECTLKWNDPVLNIDWQVKAPIVSQKDYEGISFLEFKTPFDNGH